MTTYDERATQGTTTMITRPYHPAFANLDRDQTEAARSSLASHMQAMDPNGCWSDYACDCERWDRPSIRTMVAMLIRWDLDGLPLDDEEQREACRLAGAWMLSQYHPHKPYATDEEARANGYAPLTHAEVADMLGEIF